MTERGSAEAGPISAYLAELDEPVRGILAAIVARARVLVPDVTEGMSYAMPALLHRGRGILAVRETARHLALYPYSGKVIAGLERELAGLAFSTGAVKFSAERPLPQDLVDRIVLARRDEIDAALAR